MAERRGRVLLAPWSGRGRIVVAACVLAVLVAVVATLRRNGGAISCGPTASAAASQSAPSAARSAFPLRVSSDRRYLVDRRGRPFLLVGDSPQALVGDLCPAEADAFIADRERMGFDALWVNLLCTSYTGCRGDGETRDRIAPFRVDHRLATPNLVYFDRVARVVAAADRAGIVVLLDPIETGGWLTVLRQNGLAAARAYGRFLGARFRAYPNIVWLNGNDFQTWRTAADDALVRAVAEGIRSVDRQHLQTVELDYPRSASLDDASWRGIVGVDAAYTYFSTYAEVQREYRRRSHLPVLMIEASYELEQNGPTVSKGTPSTLRRQEYWSALSGAAGQLYGNHYTWQFIHGWQSHLDTVGVRQLGYLTKLLKTLPWYRLVPDSSHLIVVAGYGRYSPNAKVGDGSYVTVAATPDRSLALAYLPAGGSVVVDAARLRRPLRARWFDPTSGRFRAATPAATTGPTLRRFTAPARNRGGDRDWLLVVR